MSLKQGEDTFIKKGINTVVGELEFAIRGEDTFITKGINPEDASISIYLWVKILSLRKVLTPVPLNERDEYVVKIPSL